MVKKPVPLVAALSQNSLLCAEVLLLEEIPGILNMVLIVSLWLAK
jgi:hypothetical protein